MWCAIVVWHHSTYCTTVRTILSHLHVLYTVRTIYTAHCTHSTCSLFPCFRCWGFIFNICSHSCSHLYKFTCAFTYHLCSHHTHLNKAIVIRLVISACTSSSGSHHKSVYFLYIGVFVALESQKQWRDKLFSFSFSALASEWLCDESSSDR